MNELDDKTQEILTQQLKQKPAGVTNATVSKKLHGSIMQAVEQDKQKRSGTKSNATRRPVFAFAIAASIFAVVAGLSYFTDQQSIIEQEPVIVMALPSAEDVENAFQLQTLAKLESEQDALVDDLEKIRAEFSL